MPTLLERNKSSGHTKEHGDSNCNIFKKKGLHILHLNVNNLLPKIDEIHFTEKQSNASIKGHPLNKYAKFSEKLTYLTP